MNAPDELLALRLWKADALEALANHMPLSRTDQPGICSTAISMPTDIAMKAPSLMVKRLPD